MAFAEMAPTGRHMSSYADEDCHTEDAAISNHNYHISKNNDSMIVLYGIVLQSFVKCKPPDALSRA